MIKSVKRYKPLVGMSSLVGIHGENYPLSFGNYCSIDRYGPYLVNMWAENLQEWARRNRSVEDIEVTVFQEGDYYLGLVTDPEIKDWCNAKPCINGHGWGTREICEEVCKLMGVDTYRWICGCEDLKQSPRIGGSFSYEPKQGTHNCHNCGRTWPMKFE